MKWLKKSDKSGATQSSGSIKIDNNTNNSDPFHRDSESIPIPASTTEGQMADGPMAENIPLTTDGVASQPAQQFVPMEVTSYPSQPQNTGNHASNTYNFNNNNIDNMHAQPNGGQANVPTRQPVKYKMEQKPPEWDFKMKGCSVGCCLVIVVAIILLATLSGGGLSTILPLILLAVMACCCAGAYLFYRSTPTPTARYTAGAKPKQYNAGALPREPNASNQIGP